jgi:hypothetical protein
MREQTVMVAFCGIDNTARCVRMMRPNAAQLQAFTPVPGNPSNSLLDHNVAITAHIQINILKTHLFEGTCTCTLPTSPQTTRISRAAALETLENTTLEPHLFEGFVRAFPPKGVSGAEATMVQLKHPAAAALHEGTVVAVA